jgi:hypothetical protein
VVVSADGDFSRKLQGDLKIGHDERGRVRAAEKRGEREKSY